MEDIGHNEVESVPVEDIGPDEEESTRPKEAEKRVIIVGLESDYEETSLLRRLQMQTLHR